MLRLRFSRNVRPFDSFEFLFPVRKLIGGRNFMLWTIILILLVLWALGFGLAGEAIGGLIHILLIVAIITLVMQLVRGRRV